MTAALLNPKCRLGLFERKSLSPTVIGPADINICRSWEGRLPFGSVCEASITEAVDDQFFRGGDCDKLLATNIEIGHRVGIPAPIQLLLPENFPSTGPQSAKAIVVG